MTRPVGRTAEELIDAALRPYSERPPAEEVGRLIVDLTFCGIDLRDSVRLIPLDRRGPQGESAIEEWEYSHSRGPVSAEPNDQWNHARLLARAARALTVTLAEAEVS